MRKSNYDKFPSVSVKGNLWKGWDSIIGRLKEECARSGNERYVLVVECYQGVYYDELLAQFAALAPSITIDAGALYKSTAEIEAMTDVYMTDDRLFGRRASLFFKDYFDDDKVQIARKRLEEATGLVLVFGHGAAEIVPSHDMLVYADMARWEIQQRFRRKEINGLGVMNKDDAPSTHYKRGYFIDWIVCDNLKKQLISDVDYWLDTHQRDIPKMIAGETMCAGLETTAHRPFRVVPFFDPAPWGGQWMKEVCDLDKSKENFGWCFDCVPEENSLYLNVGGEIFEMASNNVVFHQTKALLGAPVEARFGKDFPIRFDFLDTMGGGHLSLQVHPTTQYIRDMFGIYYTQDESYYLLDAGEGATVYLGLKDDAKPDDLINALNAAQETGGSFDVEKYINCWQAKKHDHYLIPAGTIHCSGAEAMVLEISATPSLFTFKLWDWGRLGLDGLPRPINIKHGSNVIQWDRKTEFTYKNLVNRFEPIATGEGWREERTGLHENEFIETRRHWFTGKALHNTGGGVNVLNLVEGDEAIVESPTNSFEPFVVHYAETFIIPASVGDYTIRPHGASTGKECGTLKAYVRFRE